MHGLIVAGPVGSRLIKGALSMSHGPRAKSYFRIMQWKWPEMIAQLMLLEGVTNESCGTPVAAPPVGAVSAAAG